MLRIALIIKECGFRFALAFAMIACGAYAIADAARSPTVEEAAGMKAIEAFATPVVSTGMVGWAGAAVCVLGLVSLVRAVREARRWVSVE